MTLIRQLLIDDRTAKLPGVRVTDYGILEQHGGHIIPLESKTLFHRLHRLKRRLRNEDRKRSRKAPRTTFFKCRNHGQLFCSEQADMEHFTNHDIDRFGRKVIEGIGLNHLDAIGVRVSRKQATGLTDKFGLALDEPTRLACGAAKNESTPVPPPNSRTLALGRACDSIARRNPIIRARSRSMW
jgi:hypothetical protein